MARQLYAGDKTKHQRTWFKMRVVTATETFFRFRATKNCSSTNPKRSYTQKNCLCIGRKRREKMNAFVFHNQRKSACMVYVNINIAGWPLYVWDVSGVDTYILIRVSQSKGGHLTDKLWTDGSHMANTW